MAIDLLNSFLQKGNQISPGRETSVRSTQEQPISLQAQQVLRGIRMLQSGQTLQGEIISVKGDQVQLEILKEVLIEAKLSSSLSLIPGTNMVFQVKGNQNGTLSLLPLFTNVSADPNILKALDMAGITANDRSTEMVQLMMEKGMSINKQSLLEMYRDIVGYKEVPVSDIVSLKHMGIGITEDNINEYTDYKNHQHFLTSGFEEIGNSIGIQLEQWMKEGKIEKVSEFLQKLDYVFHGENGGEKDNLDSPKNLPFSMSQASEIEFTNQDVIEVKMQNVHPSKEGSLYEEVGKETPVTSKELPPLEKENEQNIKAINHNPETIEELGKAVLEGKIPKKILSLFSEIWNREIEDNWMIRPEEVFEKKKINHLYQKIEQQVKHLEKVLEDTVSNQSAVSKVVHQTSSNLEFMNQLNQMHAYIQLPLKMTNQNTSGELYVFTNKKAISEKEGKVSALLHLDMEYLGKLDIHVALEDKKVATNFYLEKEEILDFLEAHMELLSSRLQKRGYQCNIKTNLRKEKEESVIQRIEKKESNQILLSTQAFDMRA